VLLDVCGVLLLLLPLLLPVLSLLADGVGWDEWGSDCCWLTDACCCCWEPLSLWWLRGMAGAGV
jgi:hypothetical protein